LNIDFLKLDALKQKVIRHSKVKSKNKIIQDYSKLAIVPDHYKQFLNRMYRYEKHYTDGFIWT
jgi:hypothetical protein